MPHSHTLDAASPLVLNVAALPHAPGSAMPVLRDIPAPQDFGTDVIAVRPGDLLHLDASAQSVQEGVLLMGSVSGTAHGDCTRCLEGLAHDVTATFHELFYYPHRAKAALEADPEADPEDFRQLEGDLIDLEPMLRDVVIPMLPFAPLCRVDCPGLCSVCGVRLDGAPPDHRHEDLDPRWAGLADLMKQDDTQEQKR